MRTFVNFKTLAGLLLLGCTLGAQAATTQWNLLSFGARPDGSANIDAAWAMMLRSYAGSQQNTLPLQVPGGRYIHSSPLYMTNISMQGMPNQTWFRPGPMAGAALTIITTNANSFWYSQIATISGIGVDGVNNPSGTGICLGTNYLHSGNYSANISLRDSRVINFTNGWGLALGNILNCIIEKFSADSNKVGIGCSSTIGITTTTIRDSAVRWSLNCGMVLSNWYGTVGPNVTFEANKSNGARVYQGLKEYCVFDGDWFEDNFRGSTLDLTNRFDIEVYPVGASLDSYKRRVVLQNNHFAASNLGLLTTNIGQVVWGQNDVSDALDGFVTVRGPTTALTVMEFPWLFRFVAQDFFQAPEIGQGAINFVPMDFNTNQFEAFGENPLNGRALRGYFGNGGWTTNLGVYINGSNNVALIFSDTATNGHTYGWFIRGTGGPGGVPGRILLEDLTLHEQIYSVDTGQATFNGNVSVITNLTVNADGHVLGGFTVEGAGTYSGTLNVLGSINTPLFTPTTVLTTSLTSTNGLNIVEGTTAPTAAALGAGNGRAWASNSVPPTIYWTSTADGITATTYKVAGP